MIVSDWILHPITLPRLDTAPMQAVAVPTRENVEQRVLRVHVQPAVVANGLPMPFPRFNRHTVT